MFLLPPSHLTHLFCISLNQIVELLMCALSNCIREKPDWWEKIKDDTIVEKWREEALEQAEENDEPGWDLTPGMVRTAYRLTEIGTIPYLISPGQIRARGA